MDSLSRRCCCYLSGGGVGVLWTAAGEVGGLIRSDGRVVDVVAVGGQRVALLRLQRLIGCWQNEILSRSLCQITTYET